MKRVKAVDRDGEQVEGDSDSSSSSSSSGSEGSERTSIAQDLAQERYKYMDAESDEEGQTVESVPFRGDPEFQALRCDLHKEVQEMRVKFSQAVVAARLADLEQRQLTPDCVDAALAFKQRALRKNRKKYEAELRTRQPGGDANAADERAVHHERQQVLQLLKVLHRRQLAVLRGYKVSTRPLFMRVNC